MTRDRFDPKDFTSMSSATRDNLRREAAEGIRTYAAYLNDKIAQAKRMGLKVKLRSAPDFDGASVERIWLDQAPIEY